MKFIVLTLFVFGLIAQSSSKTVSDDKVNDERKTEKRGAVQLQETRLYATSAPALASVSHGSGLLTAGASMPGIVYAPEKQIVASASPSQLYAKPSPHLAKISDAVLAGQQAYSGLISNQLYQAPQAYKVGFSAPTTYSVSAPVASQLAYSKHQIYPQIYSHQPQVAIQQPQVHYSAYTQPQAVYSQPQVNYALPQVSQFAQPHYTQIQVQPQHQVQYVQPQVSYQHQPQIQYHSQPITQQVSHQVAYAQPQATISHAAYTPNVVAQPIAKLAHYQPAVLAQPVYTSQSVGSKNEGAVSYASFSQGHNGAFQYSTPVAKVSYTAPSALSAQAAAVLSKQVVAPVAAAVYPSHQYYQQPQVQQVYSHGQDYSVQPQVSKVTYTQPQVTYAPQYFGKIAQGSPIAYSGYNH